MMADFAARHRHWILVKVVSLKKLSLRAEEWNFDSFEQSRWAGSFSSLGR